VGYLREALKNFHVDEYTPIDSYSLYQMASDHGLSAIVQFTPEDSHTTLHGCFRAIFSKSAENRAWILETEREYWTKAVAAINDSSKFVNSPYDPLFQSSLEGRIQEAVVTSLRLNMLIHAIPSEFVFLHEIAKLPNGKFDRRALGQTIANGTAVSRHKKFAKRVPPADDYEKDMVALWEKVLNVSDISMLDSFQDLGGNSLTLTFVRNHISTIWKTKLTFGELWDLKTPRDMVRKIKEQSNSLASHSKV